MDTMPDLLRKHDTELVELKSGGGSILVCPNLQGRVFCLLGDTLVHRLDVAALEHPSPDEFNNLGGNSLWPAPEGGAFAFNYLPGSDRWLVQEGIGKTPARVVFRDETQAIVEKRIVLTNRKGVEMDLTYRRGVVVGAMAPPKGYDLAGVSYRTEDTLEPIGSFRTSDVLLAPWSLEQFPGAEGVTAFCKVPEPETAINFDFYTHPGDRIHYGDGFFTFALGGEPRHQIGVKAASLPELLGALDANRSILFLRRTPAQAGVYFNIADNEQSGGPYSAADLYSVFNGGGLNFFELETIGAMQVAGEHVAASTLASETTILSGPVAELRRYLAEQHAVRLESHTV